MLFYNHKQEFIGIDEEGLKLLNYATLEDLLSVCSDVADLFAKEPGYIHNFKSFGWIDFLLHADSDARSAIVHGNGRTFSCTLQVNSLFLSAEPSQPGYIIDLLHVQSISGDEFKPQPMIPKSKTDVKSPIIESAPSILPNYDHITPTTLSEPGILDVPSFAELEVQEEPIEDLYAKLSLPLNDEELEKDFFIPEPSLSSEAVEETKAETRIDLPMLGDVRYSNAEKEFINTLKVDKSYRFDPNVAAQELGLPVDLIQEFIGDFIQQANEFKEELFEAVLRGDINNLKILSHKLKGVAANLRIEDAFETLSVINTSDDSIEIEANLKYFYTIIEKLEGKEAVQEEVIEETLPTYEPISLPENDDIYEFAFKEKEPLLIHEEHLYQNAIEKDATPIELAYDEPFKEIVPPPEESIPEEIPEVETTRTLHYDKFFIAGQLGIEVDFFNELIDEYKHDALRAGSEISGAISAFDTHAWKKTASQLKGISDNLRLNEISDELAILSQTNDAQEANKASKRLNSFLEQL
ncbi:MAG: hypothetical protein Q8O20_01805 [Sulfuricurvum sp.]|uniref:hypothetical protein n=1 Tax=Sulfuricurvum sp. TaxID=2025608 RepID=UPI00273321CE|nr:hypothetical protein [Sulfuricurvum sp.]MDP2849787.1 hypothetical protein [Sulfuricurvum sp.]